MKRLSANCNGWATQGVAWLQAVACLPASRDAAPLAQSETDWLGWDGWVNVSQTSGNANERATP